MRAVSGGEACEITVTKYVVAESRVLLLLLRITRINALDLRCASFHVQMIYSSYYRHSLY